MALLFKDCRGEKWDVLAEKLVVEIKKDIGLLVPISRVFTTYHRKNDLDFEEIEEHIDLVFSIPTIKVDTSEIVKTMKKIYRETKFEDIMGDFLEAVVFAFGPFSGCCERYQCCVEPKIWDNSYLIGEGEQRCDVVYYENDQTPLEFVECKANICNVIPRTLPFEMASSQHKKKVVYLANVHRYLSETFNGAEIYFACYNENYDSSLQNIRVNWGYTFVRFINTLEIMNYVKHRQAV